MNRLLIGLFTLAALTRCGTAQAADPPVRGVISRAAAPVKIDGKMDEWAGAFMTPVSTGHPDWRNRAAVWSYLWDDEKLYIGLRCLDEKPFNRANGPIYDGDGVEFYLDLRAGEDLGKPQWGENTLHMFWTGQSDGEFKPRMAIRPGIAAFQNLKLEGAEVACTPTPDGYELEFALPWKLFPNFKPEAGRVIGIDCELCSSDGGPRRDRNWVYSGVEAVGGPAVFGRVQLVDRWDPATQSTPYAEALAPAYVTRGNAPLYEPSVVTVGVAPSVQKLVSRVEMTVSGRPLPFVDFKFYGPGWLRVQTCLVGFTNPKDKMMHVRLLDGEGKVVCERDIPL